MRLIDDKESDLATEAPKEFLEAPAAERLHRADDDACERRCERAGLLDVDPGIGDVAPERRGCLDHEVVGVRDAERYLAGTKIEFLHERCEDRRLPRPGRQAQK